MKSIDIFYKTWHKDFALLKYSLQSLKKNVTGYNNVVILVPEKEASLFDLKDLPENTTVVYVKEYGNGYLYQQVCKLQAYKYCESEFILFADSDCIFDKPVKLNEIVENNKPTILYTDYSKVEGAICWKEPTEKFMREPVEWEFMRRNFLIYHRATLEKIAMFDPYLELNVMQSDRFSEFNAIGAWAFKYEKDEYTFINTDNWEYTEPLGMQLWGWADKNNPDETHQKEYQRSLDAINNVLGLNLTEI